MKKEFAGYYSPSDQEFAELWATARIMVDANVLLAAYSVSPSTREELFKLLERVRDRLWIPHQFALEYQRNRCERILEQVKYYDDTHKILRAVIDDQFRSRTHHPFLPAELENGLEEVCAHLLAGKDEQEKLLTTDPHFERTTELFEGNVGGPYHESELNKVYDAGAKRYDRKIPPGYADRQKPEPGRYGDYVGWRQILDFATKNNVPVILITDDDKEDWWRKERGKTYGPHPELVVEFRSCCSSSFYMYSSDRFLELSEKYLGEAVDQKAVDELKERRESETQAEVAKATEVNVGDSLSTKPSTYVLEVVTAEKPDLFAPKTTGEELVKPEEK